MPSEVGTLGDDSQPQYLTDEQVVEAMEALTEKDWKNVDRAAARMWPKDPSHLFNETFIGIDPRKRHEVRAHPIRFRADIPFVSQVHDAMTPALHRIRRRELPISWGSNVEAVADPQDRVHDEDRAKEEREESNFLDWFAAALNSFMATAADQERIEQAAELAKLADRPTVQRVAEGIHLGLRGKALCEFAGVDKTTLATMRRMIVRRRSDKQD